MISLALSTQNSLTLKKYCIGRKKKEVLSVMFNKISTIDFIINTLLKKNDSWSATIWVKMQIYFILSTLQNWFWLTDLHVKSGSSIANKLTKTCVFIIGWYKSLWRHGILFLSSFRFFFFCWKRKIKMISFTQKDFHSSLCSEWKLSCAY